MKNKILAGIAVAVACVGLAIAGEQYIDYLKTDVVVVMRRLAIGTMSPNMNYIVDTRGNTRQIGTVVLSTSTDSTINMELKGAIVTLSTKPATVGQIWLQTSNMKVYVSTRVPAENDPACALAACYSAFN